MRLTPAVLFAPSRIPVDGVGGAGATKVAFLLVMARDRVEALLMSLPLPHKERAEFTGDSPSPSGAAGCAPPPPSVSEPVLSPEVLSCLREPVARVTARSSLFLLLFHQDLGRRNPALSRVLIDRAGESDGTVLPVLDFLVTGLDDPQVARGVLHDVTGALARRGLAVADHACMAAAVRTAMAQVLGAGWTAEVAEAWARFEAWALGGMAEWTANARA